MLIDLLHIPEERFRVVENGATIDLGGRSLQFIYTPWVHWPETMVTYLKEDGILFSCDFLGAHLASSDLFTDDKAALHLAAKRYFGEIMMPFRAQIQKNLDKIGELKFDIVAPSHGPLYKEPKTIVDSYRDWAGPEPKNLAVIPYVTMHGSTGLMVEHLVGALIDQGVTVKRFDLTSADIGELGTALVDAATIVLGTPTVLTGGHPLALYAAHLANALRPKVKYISLIGSYGWATKVVEQIGGILSNLKVEILTPVIVKGAPVREDFAALDHLAGEIAARHRENGFRAYYD
jgi:flavorubredoxin